VSDVYLYCNKLLMKNENLDMDNTESNDLNLYIKLGNDAGKNGELNDSLTWYSKGLAKAKELRDQKKTTEFSALIFMLM